MSALIRARVWIRGTRPLLQNQFTQDSIPLKKREKTGVAGHDPEEWKRSAMVAENGQLYVRAESVWSMLVAGAVFTKKGRGSIQPIVRATLLVLNDRVMLDRKMPDKAWPLEPVGKCSLRQNDQDPVFIDVSGVVNPGSSKRNLRYRLGVSAGWMAEFDIMWDKTLINREQMEAVTRDAGILIGLGDGRKVGKGRFEVIKFETTDAEKQTAA